MELVPFQFDHLVQFTVSPELAVESMRQIGCRAVPGGEHEQWGSYNSLCYFDLSYIEYLGIKHPEKAGQVQDNDLIRQAHEALPACEGFARIALRTGRIEEEAERMRKLGLEVTGPFAGSRARADGTVIRWSMFFLKEPSEAGMPLPFVIEWGQDDAERRIDLQNRGVIGQHPAGPLVLRRVVFAVHELEATVDKWCRWFRLERGSVFDDREFHAKCIELMLPGGCLQFCAPSGPGIVAQQLQERGEGPFAVLLTGSDKAGTNTLMGGLYKFD
ncbi:MAG: glyoxalase-like protein [Paenibacillaceae bacterium]|jgi:hypothetical protein|nr:glyoxalase-like protein [Paenibacillaceae bacterium]